MSGSAAGRRGCRCTATRRPARAPRTDHDHASVLSRLVRHLEAAHQARVHAQELQPPASTPSAAGGDGAMPNSTVSRECPVPSSEAISRSRAVGICLSSCLIVGLNSAAPDPESAPGQPARVRFSSHRPPDLRVHLVDVPRHASRRRGSRRRARSGPPAPRPATQRVKSTSVCGLPESTSPPARRAARSRRLRRAAGMRLRRWDPAGRRA